MLSLFTFVSHIVLFCVVVVVWPVLTFSLYHSYSHSHHPTVGQGQSSPLTLMTDHFSDFRTEAGNLSLEVRKSKLITFCSAEWPTFSVGSPQEGSFALSVTQAVQDSHGPRAQRSPDQIPYILTWQSLVKNPPRWLKPFLSSPAPGAPTPPGATTPSSPSHGNIHLGRQEASWP